MELELHSMKRRQLQSLCKKHGIPANLTNLEMANRLSSLLKDTESPDAYEPSSSSNLAVEEVSNEIDSAVAPRKAKKVRFNPEDETFVFLRSEAKVTTIGKRTRGAFKKNLQESCLQVRSIASEVESSSATKKQVVGRRNSERLKKSGSVIEKLLPVVETTQRKLRSRGFPGEKRNGLDDRDMEASKKNVPLKQQGSITRQSKCKLNTLQLGDEKTESGLIKVVPEIIEGKKSERSSSLARKEEVKVLVEPQEKGALPRRSRRKSVGLQSKDPQEPDMKVNEGNEAVSRTSRRKSVRLLAKDPQKAMEKKQSSSSMQPFAKRTSETESFAGPSEKSEHVVDFTATNHNEAQVPRTSRRSIQTNYPHESVMKENELQSQVSLRQSSRRASKRQSLAPSNSVSVAQAKKQKSSGLRSLEKEDVLGLTATTHKEAKATVAESVGLEDTVEVEKEIVQLVEDKVKNGSCMVSQKTTSLTSYLDCKDIFLKLDAVRDSETELSSEKKMCSLHEVTHNVRSDEENCVDYLSLQELLSVDRMDTSNDSKYKVAVQVNISGSPVTVTNGTENEEYDELQNKRTAQPSVEAVPIAPASLRDQETAFVAEVQCSGQSYSRIADTDENPEQDQTSGNEKEMSPKHSEVSVIVSESLQNEVVCLISGKEKHDLEGHVDYAPRDHSLGLREDTRESPENMTLLDANESEIMKCKDATELQESEGGHVSGDSISLETTFEDKVLVSDANCKDGKKENEEDKKPRDNENGLSFRKASSSAERDSPTESQSRFQIEFKEYNALEKSSYSLEQSPVDEEENAPVNPSLQFSQNALVGRFTCREFFVLKDDGTEGLLSAVDETDEAGPKLSDCECQNNAIEKGSQEDSHIPLASDKCENQNDASLEEIGLPIAAMAVDECAPEANTIKEVAAAEVDVEDCAGSTNCDQCDEEAKEMGSEDLKQTVLPLKSCNNESSPETVLETPGAFNKRETDSEMETDLETKIGCLDDKKDKSVTIFEEEASGSIRGGAESVKTKMLISPQFLNNGGKYNGTLPRRQNSSFQLEELFKASSEKSNNSTEVDADTDGAGVGADVEGLSFQSYSVNEAVSMMNDSVTNGEQHDCIDLKQVTELYPSLGLPSHGKLEEITSSIDNSYESHGTMYELMASLGKESDCLPTLGSEPLGVEREETTIFQRCHSQDSLDCSSQEEIVGTIFNEMAQNVDEAFAGEAIDEKTTVDAKLNNEESNDEYQQVSPDSCAADNVMDEWPQKESHMQLILPELRTREDDEAFQIIPDSVELNTERFNIITDTIGDGGIDESRSTSLEVMTSLVKGSECLLQIHEMIQESKPLNVERGETLQECCAQDSAYSVSNAAETCAGEATNDAKLDGCEDIDELEVKDPVHDTAVSSIVSGNDAVYLEIQNNLGQDSSDRSPSSHEENNDEYHEIAPDSCAADNVTDEGPHEESQRQSTLPELQTREVDEVFHLIPDSRELNVDKSGIIVDTIGGDDMDESRATSLEVTTSLEKGSERLLQINEMIQESKPLNVEREEISTVQEFCGQDSAYLLSSAAEICSGEATNGAKINVDEDTDEMEVKDPDTADTDTGGNDSVSLEKENYFGLHSSDQSPSSHVNNFLEGEYQVFTEWETRLFSSGVPNELEKEPTGSQQKDDTEMIDLIEMTDTEVFTELEIRLLSTESTGSQQKDDTEMIDFIGMTDTELEIRFLSAESTGSKRMNENADPSEPREDFVVPKDLVVENEDPQAEEVRTLEDYGSAICKDSVVENEDPKAEEVRNLEDSGSVICNEDFLYDKKPHREEEHESFQENSTEIRNLSNANCEDYSTVAKECTDCYNEGIACKDSRKVECATALCDSAINIDDIATQENLRLSNHSGELNTERSNIITVKESDCLLQIHEMIPESEPFGVERGVQECCHEDSGNLFPNALEIGSGEAANGANVDDEEDTDEMDVKDPFQDTAVSCIVSGNDAVSLVIQNDFFRHSSDQSPSSHANDFLDDESEVFTEWEMMLFSPEIPRQLEKEPSGSQQKEETGRSRHNTEMMVDLLEVTDTDVFNDREIKLLSEEYTGSERVDDNAGPSEERDVVVSKDLVVENEDPKVDEVSNLEGSGNAICSEAFLYDKKPNQEEEHESFPENSTEIGFLIDDNCEDDSTIVKERTDCDNDDNCEDDSTIVKEPTDCDNEDVSCKDSTIVECTTSPCDSAMNTDDRAAQENLTLPNHMISSSMGRTEGKPDAIAVTPKGDEVSNLEGSGNAICSEAFLYVKKPNQEEEHEAFPENSTEIGFVSDDNCEDVSTIVKEHTDLDNEDISCKDSTIVECTTAPSDSAMNTDDRAAQENLTLQNHMISSSMGRTEGKPDAIAVTPKKPMNNLDMKENVVSSKGQHLTATKSVAKRQPLKDLQQKLI